MYLDIGKELVNFTPKNKADKGHVYVKAVSISLARSPFKDSVKSISIRPDVEGSQVSLEDASGNELIYPLRDVVTNSFYMEHISDENDEDAESLIAISDSLRCLSGEICSKGDSELSRVSKLMTDIKHIVHPEIKDWYLNSFLGISYFSEADDLLSCFYIKSPIGPLAILSFQSDEVNEDGELYGLADINYISTSKYLQGLGLGNKLYTSLATFCIDQGLLLRRGQPSLDTSQPGYDRREIWLRERFADLVVINHRDRDILDTIKDEAPQILKGVTQGVMDEIINDVNKNTEKTFDREIAIHMTVASFSYRNIML